jgi:hypothetical protein
LAEMASGQRGFDALLLGEEPIERVVEFLLVDLALLVLGVVLGTRPAPADRRGRALRLSVPLALVASW